MKFILNGNCVDIPDRETAILARQESIKGSL